jgi:endonuclease/exonuclease/phosphatase family metal-dependent hydrolase
VLAAGTLVVVVALALLLVDDGLTPQWVALGYLVGMPSLAHLWAAADRGEQASAVPVAIGGVLWVVLLFAYYAGYDLGYRADVVVIAVAAGIGIVAALPSRVERAERTPLPAPHAAMIAGLAVLAAAVAAVGPSVTIRPVTAAAPEPGTTTVAAYNLRMGYGIDGRFAPRQVAEVLATSQVALISEVDRGWYLNGGQDQLAILERLLGRTGWFGAAADPVWGDAVLIDADRVRVQRHPLASHGAVTGAQALSVQADGSSLTFVSTHLQPTSDGVSAQAADLAHILEGVLAEGGPVVLGGDFNMLEGSEAYRSIVGTGLVDADPGGTATSPADDPQQRIDYVFLTPDLSVTQVEVPRILASDHLPVLVTVDHG